MNIDFTAKEVAGTYRNMTEEIIRAFDVFLQNMEQRCRKHAYEPMVNFVNAMQRFYQEDLQQHVLRTYQQWDSSEYSLERLATRIGAGSGAEATGRRYMHEVEESVHQMFRRTMPELRVDTDAPVVSERDIEEIGSEITHFIQNAERSKDQWVSYVNSRAMDNLLFACTRPIIVTTGESIVESFRSMIKEVVSGADLFQSSTNAVRQMVDGFSVQKVEANVSWPADVRFR